MKKLMLTTALSGVVAFGAVAQTQTNETAQDSAASMNVPAFMVSELTGKSLYTLDSDEARELSSSMGIDSESGGRADESIRWTSSETFVAGRDNWEDIGEIGDVVMTQDGEVRGIILDVGGFLGFGTHTVMVQTDDLFFVTETDAEGGEGDFSVVIAMSQDQLESLPEWDAEQLQTGFEMSGSYQQDTGMTDSDMEDTGMSDTAMTDADMAEESNADGTDDDTDNATTSMAADTETETMADADEPMAETVAPANQADTMDNTGADVFGGDYAMLETEERTADRLMGANVHEANGEDIGNVNDVVLDGDQNVTGLLVDVGGFLGIGSHTVNLPIDQAQIGWSESSDEVRVQVSMTAEELEAMPEHDG